MAASGEPGVFTMRQRATVPLRERESAPNGLVARMSSSKPGASRSRICNVASGVRSRGEKPVPPVVTMRPANPRDIASSDDATELTPSGTTRTSSTSKPESIRRALRSGPAPSSRRPSLTESDTVSIFAR